MDACRSEKCQGSKWDRLWAFCCHVERALGREPKHVLDWAEVARIAPQNPAKGDDAVTTGNLRRKLLASIAAQDIRL